MIMDAILRLFRSFPANGKVDRDTIQDYCETAAKFQTSVAIDVVSRFCDGDVEGQSRTFVPSIPDFVHEARRLAEIRQYRALPPVPRPTRYHAQTVAELPCIIRHKQRVEQLSHRDVLYKDANLDRYVSLSRARGLPEGATWYWGTQCIYGPDKRIRRVEVAEAHHHAS